MIIFWEEKTENPCHGSSITIAYPRDLLGSSVVSNAKLGHGNLTIISNYGDA